MAKNMLAASGGNAVFFGSQLVRSLFLASLIGPTDFGAWNLGHVFLQYAQWSHLSILNAFRLDGARSRGAGDTIKLEKLRRLTWTACMVPALVTVLFAAGIALRVEEAGARNAVLMLAVLLLPYQLYSFVTSYLNTEERFGISARMQAIYAVLNMGLTLALGLLWGFWGALLAQVASYGLVLFFHRQHFPIYLTPLVDWPLIREQFKIGLPLWLNGLVYTLFMTMDRTLIATALGVAALGQYSLTALARSSIGLVPNAISEVLYMRVSTQYGETKTVKAILPLVLRTNTSLAYLMAPLIGLVIIWTPWVVHLILPAYQPGVSALQIFLIGLFFTFPTYAGILLMSVGRAADLLVFYGLATGLQTLFVLRWIPDWGIVGAALATAVSSAFLLVAINVWGLRYAGLGFRRIAAHILECLLPLAGVLVGIAVGWVVMASSLGVTASFVHSLIITGVFLAFNLPLLWWGIRTRTSDHETGSALD